MGLEKEYWGMPAHTYCTILHLSQLLSFVSFGLGLVVPVLMWVVNKDNNKQIDQHGRVVLNWILSAIIYSIISGVLVFLYVGYLGLALVAFLTIIFSIVGAMKANQNELWSYPFSIRFFDY
ncbi:MAG: DUF4870 domain-containing protein [Pseudomonadota bacterium]